MASVVARARGFLESQARLLDRRAFEAEFEGGSPNAVATVLRGYKNADGGFGHALEPDLRTSSSQPIFVEIALLALRQAGADPGDVLDGVPAFLESVSTPEGALSPALPGAPERPCARHWQSEWATTPQLNPTAGIVAHLHFFGVHHAWLDRATSWCLQQMAQATITSAHTIRCAFTLLAERPDPAVFDRLARQLPECEWYAPTVPVTAYGVTPLQIAPSPADATRALFPDDLIEAHLDDLLARQQPDGGWPIHWEAPGPAAVAEWRGRWTLDALLTLRAYRRI